MKSIDVYIYTVISLFGVAYPILLQVVARLDEKYSSDKIVELFNQESIKKQFTIGLMFSLAFLFIWSLNLPVLVEKPYWLFFLLRRSASLLVIISTIFLIIIFFLFVEKVITYYTPSKFIQYLINKSKKHKSEIFFEALTEVTLSFIRKKERNYMKTLNQYFYEKFRDIRRDAGKDPVIYPESHYDFINKISEELVLSQEKRNYLLEDRAVGGGWLLGPHESKKISQKTYFSLWQNLNLALQYNRDDLILNYWENSHQYFASDLEEILPEYDSSSASRESLNKEIVSERGEERRRFLEFHNILGALLLYKKKYGCLKYIFSYTQNGPSSYALLPETMDEIFQFYVDIGDELNNRFRWVSNRYPFPNLGGMNSDSMVRDHIRSYLALLFLRLYSLTPYLITDDYLRKPTPPSSISKIELWKIEIDFFKGAVKKHLQNKDLMKKLGFDFLTEEWCTESVKDYPLEYIEKFKHILVQTYEQKEFSVEISKEKVDQFKEKTKTILERTLNQILEVNNESENEKTENMDKWYVNGLWALIKKTEISNSHNIFHANFDTYLAAEISRKIKIRLGDVFLYKRSKGYLIKQDVLWKAIDRLKLNESHIIINFGIDIDKYLKKDTPGLHSEKYKSTKIINLKRIDRVRDSLFILKKSDLPFISTIAFKKEKTTEYHLEKISQQFNIYASVIDMNANEDLTGKHMSDKKSSDEVRKSALLYIDLSLEYKWHKGIEMIQIQEHSDFFQRGIPNDINEIQVLGK